MTTAAHLEKWLTDTCTVIRKDLVDVSSTRRKVDSETTIATDVPCMFDRGSTGLVQTVLGQQGKFQRRLFAGDDPELRLNDIIVDSSGVRWQVAGIPMRYVGSHQEADVERGVA